MMIARLRGNQTGVENRVIKKDQVVEFFTDYKTYLFFLLGFIANIPNGGISNFSTIIIRGLGFDTLHTSLLGIPQGVLVVIWITLGAFVNSKLPANSRTLTCCLFMIPTISGSLGFLLAPHDAYVGRLICFYMTGSYQASFVIALSVLTSNTGGQTKKMLTSGVIWFGACVGNIAGPFFFRTQDNPQYRLGIGAILVANCLEVAIFIAFRILLPRENRKKDRALEALRATGTYEDNENDTAFADLTDKQNIHFRYVY